MKLDEILHELLTLEKADHKWLTGSECEALRESIPILKRCEKYRKALLEIRANYPDMPKSPLGCTITEIIERAFDCEES